MKRLTTLDRTARRLAARMEAARDALDAKPAAVGVFETAEEWEGGKGMIHHHAHHAHPWYMNVTMQVCRARYAWVMQMNREHKAESKPIQRKRRKRGKRICQW